MPSDGCNELSNHPQRLKGSRQWMRRREIINDIVGGNVSLWPVCASHEDAHIVTRISPGTCKSQSDAFDSAGAKTVQEYQDAHLGY
jgi:hypothetical protein